MITITAAQDKVLTGNGRSEHVKVEVYDSGPAAWRDLTTYPGFDALDEASWAGDVDSPFRTATIKLWREVDGLSLAPLMSGGAISRRFDPATSPSALIALNAQIRISVAVIASDMTPVSGDWVKVFEGYIDTIDSAAGDRVQLECRDYAAKLQDAHIEDERAMAFVYYSGAIRPARIWTPSTVYASGDFIVPTDGRRTISGSPRFYECTTGGTSGTSEPAWPTSSTVADGTATHTYRGTCTTDGTNMSLENVLNAFMTWAGCSTDPNSEGLTVSGSPSWNLKPWLQSTEPFLEAMRTVVDQNGWDLRYRWSSGDGYFVLTLYQPNRAAASPDRTFGASEVDDYAALRVDKQGIRNAISGTYSDASDLDANGQPKRKTLTVTDSTSISTFGRLFFGVAESSASQIDSSSEMTTMLNAILADLKDPKASLEVTLLQGFPFVEAGDYYRFTANNRHFSSNQDLAVVSFTCTAAEGRIKTVLQCRGQPAGAYWRWHRKDVNVAKQKDLHSTALFEVASGLSLGMSAVPGGVQMTVAGDPVRGAKGEEYEFHIGTSSGFTPSSSSLVAVSKTREQTITDLLPGTTYYGKCVPRIWNASKLARGQLFGDSANKTYASAVAGKNSAGHLDSDVGWGRFPLNGGFETVLDTANNIPDHWSAQAGSWGNELTLMEDGNNITGRRWVKLDCIANEPVILRGVFFEVSESELYTLEYWYKIPSRTNPATIQVTLEFTDYSQAQSWTVDVAEYSATTSGWTKATHVFRPCAGARYVRVFFERISSQTGTIEFYLDDVRAVPYNAAAVYKSNSGQSIPSATVTIIDFEDQVYDPVINDYDAVNTSVVTTGAAWKAYARTSGRYLLTCSASLDWTDSGGTYMLALFAFINGSTEVVLHQSKYLRTDGDVEVVCGSAEVLLASGDYVDFRIYHNTGLSQVMHNDSNYNRCSFRRVGDYGDGT